MFSLALEENKLDDIWNEVKMIRSVIEDNPDFITMLCHPDMTHEKKYSVLDEIFKTKVSDDMMGFFHVLVNKGRIGEILAVQTIV